MSAPVVFAQSTETPGDSETVETVVVTGTRASLASAIDRKRRAGTVSDSIVAEDVGQFPDKNVGEALSRITGVQLSRDFGEGVAVSIRGVEPDLNRVEINGLSVLGTNGEGSRGADFRELQAELIQSIDVFKGFTADMTEGGVGGTVSIKTRKPLDFKKPTYSATFSGQKLSLDDEWTPRISLFGTRKFLDNRLGVLFNATFDHVNTRQDYTGNTEWARLADFDQSPEKTVDYYNTAYGADVSRQIADVDTWGGCSSLTSSNTSIISTATMRSQCLTQWWDYTPRTARYRVWDREDKRLSAELTLQYRINDQWSVWGSYNKNQRSQRLNDRNYGTAFTAVNRLKTGSIVSGDPASVPAGIVVDDNHNVIAYTVSTRLAGVTVGGNDAFSTSSRDFQLDIDSDYVSGGFNYRGDRLAIEFTGAHAESTYYDSTNGVTLTADSPGLKVSLDPSTGVPSFTFAPGYETSNLSAYNSLAVQYRPRENDITEDQFKLDIDYDLDLPFFTKFETGAQYRKSGSLLYRDSGYIVSTGPDLIAGTADDIRTISARIDRTYDLTTNAALLASLAGAVTDLPSSFFDGYNDVSGQASNWLVPDTAAILKLVGTEGFNHNNLRQALGTDGKVYPQIPVHDIEEEVKAAYAKLNFETGLFGLELDGNFGVRVVSTSVLAAGLLQRNERRSTPTVDNPAATTNYQISNSIVSIDESYTDVLPSFNLSTWLIPNELTVRVGWAKVMARPKMTDLVPSAVCTFDATGGAIADDDFVDICSAGNPGLKPYRADQFDLSGEWYPNRDTQFSVGLFHKDIKTYILNRTLVRNVDYFNDGNVIDVTMPINGQGAKIKGVEVAFKTAFTFLPGVFNGFGIDTNYTWSEAENGGLYSELDGSELPFPGLSEHSYNVSLWYDKGPINARLAYNGRTEYLVTAADRSGKPVYRDGSEYLDGKITWKASNGVSLFVEGKNLTGTAERATSGDIRLNELSWPGKRVFVGVTYKR
ncbi:TonB-dependent receptor [Asticcacaulis endophyticus]|uniref:TonB-dependent receptor n=1 Tax=Asticcacaulis endophyticus TaxID=1395890 RepID=A0A918Q3Z4_9CAUL|nr:TonB-dependent receptor [Asticcacaulis endophyticus]